MISDNQQALKMLNDISVKKYTSLLRRTFRHVDVHDFMSCKNMAIIKVIKFMKRVNPDRPIAKMQVLFYAFFKRELINHLFYLKRRKRTSDLEILEANDTMPKKECSALFSEQKIDIAICIGNLTPKESYVFYSHFIEKKTVKEISNELQCQKRVVSTILKQAKNNFVKQWRKE